MRRSRWWPRLRQAAVDWDDALAEVLAARMLAVLLCGLLMQAVLRDVLPARADIEAVLSRALAGDAA